MKHVLITGHTGFLGSALARRLQGAGIAVTGASRSTGFDLLRDDLPTDKVDHVYHVAGLTFVPSSWTDPVSFHHVNVHGTVRVLEHCRRAALPMTYVSGYVYGVPTHLPIAESMPARPNNPYAFSKLAAEQACRFFAASMGVQVSVLRPFNIYGPGQDDSFLIPTIARQVLDPGVAEIVVADLEPRRDFVYVEDVVDALLLAPALPAGGVYNVGSGESCSVADVIRACMAGAGTSKPFRDRGERRSNEIMDVIADISAIREACDWSPRTGFREGIRSVVAGVAA